MAAALHRDFELVGTPQSGSVVLDWVSPGAEHTTWTVSVEPADVPALRVEGGTRVVVDGLAPGTLYRFTVTRVDGPTVVSQVDAGPNAAGVVGQANSSTRPAGSLVMTVRCGTFGSLPSFSATSGVFPGFPVRLPETAANDLDTAVSAATACEPSLSDATLVSLDQDSQLGGSFFASWGQLGQVTVLDTRDGDTGWTLTGTSSDFVGSLGARFSGDYLGWIPVVTRDSARIPLGGGQYYDQTVFAGPPVLPGTGVATGDGLSTGTANVLAAAGAGAGLGEARIDTRLLLLIPVASDAQTYASELTLSLI
jgi:hypothetical protein